MTIDNLSYPYVKYRRAALTTVVCQVKFNAILRIGQEVPVAFQDRVRGEFPKFEREAAAGFRVGPGIVEALPVSPPVPRFRTEDGAWTLALGVDNMSLETSRYQDFPDFERRFVVAEESLRQVYGIDHYVRVGLRYINTFRTSEFAGGWADRINPLLLGPLTDPAVGSQVTDYIQAFKIAEADWTILIRDGVTDSGDYQLDIDHATEVRVPAQDVIDRIRDFNRRVYQVFRWAITERMHEEMEPESHA
ncbi:MAG: TIGR04255 family protein [Chloroflexi bacterium]|nr:TIGR04255 family protein [Chloroflexota bacterium]